MICLECFVSRLSSLAKVVNYLSSHHSIMEWAHYGRQEMKGNQHGNDGKVKRRTGISDAQRKWRADAGILGTCTLTLITIIGLVTMMACWTLMTLTLINWARLRIVTVGIGVMVTVVAVDAVGIKRLKIS